MNPSKKIKKVKLNKKIIWTLLFIISLIHGFMCISQGILSSCVTQIKQELNLSYEEYSLFGTLNGLGSLIGSFIFTLIINIVSHKYLICIMLIINSLAHFAFYFKLKYYFLLLSRFISGFASVFCYIYFPMWVDEFGFKSWINFMQTFVQVSNTIGHIFGYFIYYLFGSTFWKYGFLYEIFSINCLVLFLALIPKYYFDKNISEKNNINNNINNEEEIKLKNENENNNNNNNQIKKEKKETNYNYSIIKDILCNIPYMFIVLYRTNRLFVFVALDFWFSDYIQSNLYINDPSQIFISYSFSIVLSPLLGLIFGGILSNKIGGPKCKHVFKAMFYLQIFSVFFGFLSNFVKNLKYFTFYMSLYMLINSAAGLISISASYAVIPKNLIGSATGIYSIIVNLGGFLPAPYCYAVLKNIFGNGGYIILFFMGYGIIGAIFLFTADIYMKNKKIFIYKDDEDEDVIIKGNN